jgi:4-hydroxy-tetrahydrodipicolinate reductase
MTRVVLHGAGRMSQAISQLARQDPSLEVCSIVSRSQPDWDFGCDYVPSLTQLMTRPDVLIDFSLPEGTISAADWCSEQKVALVSGVTGLDETALSSLQRAASKVPVLWSPNLSVGVNLLAQIAHRVSAVLDVETPVQIEDIHHQWKKDAPSGTALMLGESVAAARQDAGPEIEYTDQRIGDVIGTHNITFQMEGELIVLSHEAQDRAVFARGAIAAAHWLGKQSAGLYTAADWISSI